MRQDWLWYLLSSHALRILEIRANKNNEKPVSPKEKNMANFETLIQGAQAGNKKDKEEIIKAFLPLVYSLTKSSRNASIREDVQSICYLAILEAVRAYRSATPGSFPGYVKKMLVYALSNAKRKQEKIVAREAVDISEYEESFSARQDYADVLVQNIVLSEALYKLPPLHRQIIKMYYVQEKSDQSIGNCLGISQQAAAKLRSKTLSILRRSMQA